MIDSQCTSEPSSDRKQFTFAARFAFLPGPDRPLAAPRGPHRFIFLIAKRNARIFARLGDFRRAAGNAEGMKRNEGKIERKYAAARQMGLIEGNCSATERNDNASIAIDYVNCMRSTISYRALGAARGGERRREALPRSRIEARECGCAINPNDVPLFAIFEDARKCIK